MASEAERLQATGIEESLFPLGIAMAIDVIHHLCLYHQAQPAAGAAQRLPAYVIGAHSSPACSRVEFLPALRLRIA